MILDLIRGKNVLLAFSDPGGAKQVLSFAAKNRHLFKTAVSISDRVQNFYPDFGFEVEDFKLGTPKQWLDSNQIDLLITGTSLPLNLEIKMIEAASKYGVVSLSLVDHWINVAARFEKSDVLVLPDWIGIIDERARQIAINEGLPSSKLLVINNQYYDYISSWKPMISRDDFLKEIGLPIDATYVLYAPEPLSSFDLQHKYSFTELDGIQMIYEAMRPILRGNIFIIIKGHPNQNDYVFLNYLAKRLDYRVKYFRNININNLLYYSQCVFGFFSNSLIEARIMGKLVLRPLMMMSNGANDPLKTMESKRFLTFYDKKDFVKAVHVYAK